MTATAPEPTGQGTDSFVRLMYWIIGGVVVLLCIIGLITFSANSQNAEAQQKAQQLVTKFMAAGLPVPADITILTRTLGTDGGVVCDDPTGALRVAILNDQISNGAAFVGRRPVIIDNRLVAGEALILETYCPEQLQKYRDKFNDLKTDDVIKD
jgi:hypothetical protein